MIDNIDDERPRFDSQTGLPIKYEEEPISSIGEELAPQNSSAASLEYTSSQYSNNYSDIPYSSTFEDTSSDNSSSLLDKKSIKAEKAAQKAAKRASNKASKKTSKNSRGSGNGFKNLIRLVAVSIMCGIIAGGTMYGLYYTGVYYFPTSASNSSDVNIPTVASGIASTTSNLISQTGISGITLDVPSIAKAAMPAVVAITGTVTTTSSGYGYFGGESGEQSTSGTGIIIGKSDIELLIVTNAHVVDGVNNLKVTFNDNEGVVATVKGSKTDKDIAVVAVKISDLKESTLSNIAIAELGDSDSIQIGESVVAIGNALGEGQSVTVGWVSALNRSITVENTQYSNLIMTDAAINPGNSGGALLNSSGQVIGINAAKYSSTGVEGMGYAIPISSVKDIIDNLSTKQTKAKVDTSQASYLGINGMDVTSANSVTYSVPQGVMVSQVAVGSPAEKAGLVKQDIIVSFDGEDITSFTGLKSLMQYYATGTTVTIAYYHYNSDNKAYDSKETEIQVTLGSATAK